MTALPEQYDEVYVYAMGRPGFLLQHVVDAIAAQTADGNSKPISIVFSLAGLYLYVEKDFSGFQVQKVHTLLAMRKRLWPQVLLPAERAVASSTCLRPTPAGSATKQFMPSVSLCGVRFTTAGR
jgi:hypothetical protein